MGTDPEFAAGSWVGVELSEANGKNDGSVKGKSYFHCQPLYGVFVRPGSIKVIEGSESTGQSRPPSSTSQSVTISGTSSPARRQSTATPFTLSRTTSSAGSSNPLQQKLTRAAAGLPASFSQETFPRCPSDRVMLRIAGRHLPLLLLNPPLLQHPV